MALMIATRQEEDTDNGRQLMSAQTIPMKGKIPGLTQTKYLNSLFLIPIKFLLSL